MLTYHDMGASSGRAISWVYTFFAKRITSFRPVLSRELQIALIAAVLFLLLAAVSDWPYNFYVLLRIIVCGSLVASLFVIYTRRPVIWIVTLGSIALIFNPISPLHFQKETWRIWNWIASIPIALFIALSLRAKMGQKDEPPI